MRRNASESVAPERQDQRRDEQVLVLLVELLEADRRKFGLLHLVDRLDDLVETDRLLRRADVGAARDVGDSGQHLFVEL